MHLIGGVLMPDANGSKTTNPSAVDIGGCLILLQSWALYRMPFLASISHQSYVFPLVNRWSTNPGIGKSPSVPIYRLMIENHAGEGYIPTLPVQLGEIHGMSKKGRYGDNWEEVHEEYIMIWNNRFGRVPQMDRAPDLQPSLEYIQWQPLRHLHHEPEPELEPEPEPEQEPEPEPELHSRDSSYHPELGAITISWPRIHLSTPLLPANIRRRTPLFPDQVHRWHLRHMIFIYVSHTPTYC
ncbi:hypothetical protein Gotur_025025 [Gossypium turneri]